MPKQLNSGQITQALQRAFGFKGRYIPMLDEVIVPVYVIADPSPAQITRLVGGTFRATVASGSNFLGFVQLFNPEGSGVLINLTSAVAQGDVKIELTARVGGLADTPGTDQGLGVRFRDRRLTSEPIGQMFSDGGSTLVRGDEIARLQVDGAFSQIASWIVQSTDPRQPLIVLRPGTGVIIQGTDPIAESYVLDVNWLWLEIPITQVDPAAGIP